MAKRSKRLVLGFLLLPVLLYAAVLRCNVSPLHLWRLQVSSLWTSSLPSNSTVDIEFAKFLLRKLVRGNARRELLQNGISCISDPESDICVTSAAVRLATGPSSPPLLYLTADQHLPPHTSNTFQVRPYPRKTDPFAMSRTSPITILANHKNPPSCDVTHPFPAVIFSNGGFAGNFFHDINDVLIPLFLTSSHLRSRIRLVIADFETYWAKKYHRVLSHLSAFDIIIASSSSTPMESRVHCFPAAVVGLKYHGNLLCNSTDAPGGISTLDFRHFLHRSLGLNSDTVAATEHPTLVLISRRKSRMMLNEEEVVETAKEVGFRVVVAKAEMMSKVEKFAELVNECSVLMGVHGAGLTNMVFQRSGSVLVQVVPWGLDWASAVYYGRPAKRMGLQYVEYHTAVEESTLYDEYPKDHPVLVDPWGINLKGYNVSKPVYTDGQDLRIDLIRLRDTLVKARDLLPRPALRREKSRV